MIKKILIGTLVLVVAAAVAVSAYNAVWARPAQSAGSLTAPNAGGILGSSPAGQGYGQAQRGDVQAQQDNSLGSWFSDIFNNNPAGQNQGAGYGRGRGGQGGNGSQGTRGQGNGAQGGGSQGGGYGQQGGGLQSLPPAGDLSQAEAQGLLYLREEEKLARDVYTALYQKWGLPEFQNISASEQMHMDSLKTLLDRYGLADPAQAEAGVFSNPELQALYNQLVERGSLSAAEAIRVGGYVEEVDILDLQERLSQTDNADLQHVYNNLLSGSSNHLGAFANLLSMQTGETYQPQVMDQAAYEAAVALGARGGGNSGQGGWGQGGRGQGARGQGGRGRTP